MHSLKGVAEPWRLFGVAREEPRDAADTNLLLERELHTGGGEREPRALLRAVETDHYAVLIFHDRVRLASGDRRAACGT